MTHRPLQNQPAFSVVIDDQLVQLDRSEFAAAFALMGARLAGGCIALPFDAWMLALADVKSGMRWSVEPSLNEERTIAALRIVDGDPPSIDGNAVITAGSVETYIAIMLAALRLAGGQMAIPIPDFALAAEDVHLQRPWQLLPQSSSNFTMTFLLDDVPISPAF